MILLDVLKCKKGMSETSGLDACVLSHGILKLFNSESSVSVGTIGVATLGVGFPVLCYGMPIVVFA